MKLNYYMRGLGIGIVVTALLMGIASSGRKEKMTDEQIRQRALEMGMVDGNVVLADMPGKQGSAEGEDKEGTDKEDSLPALSGNEIADNENPAGDTQEGKRETENNKETGVQEPENSEDEEEEAPQESTEESGEAGEENPQADNGILNEIVVITISSGDGSRVVANKLQQAGIIDDVTAFDEFLCRNGYDKRIKTGRYDIPVNATNEDIVAAITKKGY